MLEIDTLPGGTALDYVTHITQSLNDVTDTYALCNDIGQVQCHVATVTKVKSSLSDRKSLCQGAVRAKIEH